MRSLTKLWAASFKAKKAPARCGGIFLKQNFIDMGKAGRPKGLPKTGGRKKGVGNAISTDLRTFYAKLIDDNRAEIVKRLKRLDDKDFFQALDRMNRYVLPQLQALDHSIMMQDKLEGLTEVQLEKLIEHILNSEENEQG